MRAPTKPTKPPTKTKPTKLAKPVLRVVRAQSTDGSVDAAGDRGLVVSIDSGRPLPSDWTGGEPCMMSVAALKPYGLNMKDHPPAQIIALKNFIRRVGFRFPLAIDEHDVIIAGHGRHLAAQQLGMQQVPCLRHVGLSDSEKRSLRIADNKLAELAMTNEKHLLIELRALDTDGFDLTTIGFTEVDLKRLLTTPDFKPTTADEQSRLDQRIPIVCPKCGHGFRP